MREYDQLYTYKPGMQCIYNVLINKRMLIKAIYSPLEGADIEVTFDDLQFKLIHLVDNTSSYECRGFDEYENTYSGRAEFTYDEFEGITDIELINVAWPKGIKKLYDKEFKN